MMKRGRAGGPPNPAKRSNPFLRPSTLDNLLHETLNNPSFDHISNQILDNFRLRSFLSKRTSHTPCLPLRAKPSSRLSSTARSLPRSPATMSSSSSTPCTRSALARRSPMPPSPACST
ncbi:hypothetical protein CCHR01_07224 [Colletotrichum chrysophilum]|uniref:Uncharacterized protein n=1 Tax=Colletotrichum chrysophilum TaxID=1836956 RepID=A0AAD9AKG8_9PEZI|nr:hypothetical protein CCHR01_07224 [Colletotrichum chrysophilum]